MSGCQCLRAVHSKIAESFVPSSVSIISIGAKFDRIMSACVRAKFPNSLDLTFELAQVKERLSPILTVRHFSLIRSSDSSDTRFRFIRIQNCVDSLLYGTLCDELSTWKIHWPPLPTVYADTWNARCGRKGEKTTPVSSPLAFAHIRVSALSISGT